MRFSLRRIIYSTNAVAEKVNPDIMITNVSIDTRTIESDSLFIAIKGENFDGHDYALEAIEKGAVAVIVEKVIDGIAPEQTILVVDSKVALLQTAGLKRENYRGKVVVITGSVGKTTTKDMIATVLSSQGKTLKTRDNLNNEIGFSQMLFQLDDSYKYAVLEIGIDGIGQMLPMAVAAMPDVAVITNVGTAHLANFGTRETIQREKLAISEGLTDDGVFILNADDPYLSAQGGYQTTLYFGIKSLSAEVQVKNISYEGEFSLFNIHYQRQVYPVKLPLLGEHNILNASAAFTVAVALNIDPAAAAAALETFEAEGMRQHIVKHNGFTIVEDCYNASPQSMAAALETLGIMYTRGRRIAVLSDMLELGKDEIEYHKELAQLSCINEIDMLFLIGKLARYTYEEALTCTNLDAKYFENQEDLVKELKSTLRANDIVWFKASRGMHLEDVVKELYKGD